MKEVIFTQDQLQEKLLEWQKRLRLQDWIIKVKLVRERDMNLDGVQGEVFWVIEKKMATIRILDPIDYPPNEMEPQDMENILVHELLHLHFAPLRYDDFSEIAEEQAIESITSGIIASYREGVNTCNTQ